MGAEPVAGIANSLSRVLSPESISSQISVAEEPRIIITWILNGVRNLLPVFVALLAASILLTATNAGLMGISRLSYNLSTHDQLPAVFKKVHHRFRTPYYAIVLFCVVAILLLVPGLFAPQFFSDLGALYVFGSLLCFAMAHLSILALRVKEPDMNRPFKLRLNIRVKDRELPITAILGLAATFTIWVIMLITQPFSRWAGFAWMTLGLIVYLAYRLFKRK